MVRLNGLGIFSLLSLAATIKTGRGVGIQLSPWLPQMVAGIGSGVGSKDACPNIVSHIDDYSWPARRFWGWHSWHVLHYLAWSGNRWKMIGLVIVYRFDGDVDLVKKGMRSGLLLLIMGLLVLFIDLRIQGINLLPDSIGALLSVLGIRRIISQPIGTRKMITHLKRSLYALMICAVLMLPNVLQPIQGPGLVLPSHPISAVWVVFWVGSVILELVAVLHLSLVVGTWASIIDDESLEGLSRVTFRLILVGCVGYVVSLPLVVSEHFAGFFAMVTFLFAIITLFSRLLLIYSFIRTRRTTGPLVDDLIRYHDGLSR
jgi:hypothetical protein